MTDEENRRMAMTALKIGVAVLALDLLFGLVALWRWAIVGMSPNVGTACLWTWFGFGFIGVIAIAFATTELE
jgi:hypothetical protein